MHGEAHGTLGMVIIEVVSCLSDGAERLVGEARLMTFVAGMVQGLS